MKKHALTIFTAAILLSAANAQESPKAEPLIPTVKFSDNVSAKFGGYVRTEAYADSRKQTGFIENLIGIFPENESLDANGKDLNKYTRSYLSAQATRFNTSLTGPDALGAQTTAFFEFDFTGGNTINARFRHGYINLAWKKSELKLGKTWNPLADIIFPSVVGLHTGIPFRPFGRGEQIRYTFKPTQTISILAAAYVQDEHRSLTYVTTGATPTVGSNTENPISNTLPELHLQLRYKTEALQLGLVSEYKTIKPQTQTTGTAGTFASDETVASYAAGAYAEVKKGDLTVRASGLYGQNLADLFQQGGYAVTSIDSVSGARKYTPSNAFTAWFNVTYGKQLVGGLFGGYQKNLGFDDNIIAGTNTFLGRWQNIDHIYRIAPSLQYKVGRLIFAAEVDYNVAAYGKIDVADKGRVKDAKEFSAIRGTGAITFQF